MDANFAEPLAVPIEYEALAGKYRNCKSPKDKIARLAQSGALTRLKKGLYIQKGNFSRELIANRLYGPSYVSLEAALSYYGIIPERVYMVRSMTVKRAKRYDTPYGRFEYVHAKPSYFSLGIRQQTTGGVSFLIASPEKALCDMIAFISGLRIQSLKAMREFLEEDLRADTDEIHSAEGFFDSIINTGVKSREMALLREVLENG
jgi:predicted transcriptional regulator of viral defense system